MEWYPSANVATASVVDPELSVVRFSASPLSVHAMEGGDWSSVATMCTDPAKLASSQSLAEESGRNSIVGGVGSGGGGGGVEPGAGPHAASLRGALPSLKKRSVRSVRTAQRNGFSSSPVSLFTGLAVNTTHWPSGEKEGSDMMKQGPT